MEEQLDKQGSEREATEPGAAAANQAGTDKPVEQEDVLQPDTCYQNQGNLVHGG